jgi:hypothetical protein
MKQRLHEEIISLAKSFWREGAKALAAPLVKSSRPVYWVTSQKRGDPERSDTDTGLLPQLSTPHRDENVVLAAMQVATPE